LFALAILPLATVEAAAPTKRADYGPPLPGTERLTLDGDPAAIMIAGVDRFLLGELEASVAGRSAHWKRDVLSNEAYDKSVEPNRQHLARIIGLRDPRVEFADLELVATVGQRALVGRGEGFDVLAVRWPVLKGVHGEGLLLEPTASPGTARRTAVIVIPDCEQTPEQLVGLLPGVPPQSQIARRIATAGISGYFNSRERMWSEPIDRNVFGLLAEFGDAELASLIVPRPLVIEACAAPTVSIPAGGQGAPAESSTPPLESVCREVDRARRLVAGLSPAPVIELVESGNGAGPFGSEPFLSKLLERLEAGSFVAPQRAPENLRAQFDLRASLRSQFEEMADFSERLVEEGPRIRAEHFARVDRIHGIEAFTRSTAAYRTEFRERIVGDLKQPLLPAAPRSRLAYDDPGFRGYEVTIDVLPDVFLYGVLLVPRDLAVGNERRPVIVCQHGLEGRAESTVTGDNTSYRDFASRLARRGFVTFSPQHLYRGGDLFRTLQRKANPLGQSLFSVMVAQHRQLLTWLRQLPFVDPQRIAFYGISYGGKSAMRIPAVLKGYALSICSSDFSDWIWRTASNRFESGYLAHNEYEIVEFDLGTAFNYGEMAALICPRPFMVEEFHHSGHFAERSRGEFARVQLLYENLGISERTRMTYYGSYLSNFPYAERETFDFLHEHLHWPRPAEAGK
jgi:hypothetical protein